MATSVKSQVLSLNHGAAEEFTSENRGAQGKGDLSCPEPKKPLTVTGLLTNLEKDSRRTPLFGKPPIHADEH
jgi:hypothetical protein